MADADDYLQDGFDPRSVTVPRLRSILVTHNIDYPGTAKKPQLVELVNEFVLPQVPKLREQRARARRTSMGIVNAGSADSHDHSRLDDLDLEPARPVSRRSMSPRKTTRYRREEAEVTPAPARSLRRRTPSSRAASSFEEPVAKKPEPVGSPEQQQQQQQQHVPHYEPPPSVRRMRKSATPQIKVESTESDSDSEPEPVEDRSIRRTEPSVIYEDEPSVFTDDNPFQSSSSPIPLKTPTTQRRAFMPDASAKTDRTIRGARINTPYDKTPLARTFNSRVTKTPRHRSPEFSLDPTEEFTPEAQLELEEAAARGDAEVLSHLSQQARPKPARRKTSLRTPLLVLFLTLLGAYSAWYRQEKIAVGYCGLGRPATQLLPPEIPVPDFLVPLVEPQCEPCPLHAYCYQGLTARCHSDFVLKSHPLSLGGLIPLPPTCEPDGEKARRVQAVAQRAIEELRQRRAKFECGELFDEAGQRASSPAISEEELKKAVSQLRSRRLNSAEFEDLWTAALGEITTRDEIVVEMDKTATATPTSNGTLVSGRRLSSSSLARLPLACAFRRSIRLGLARYRLAIGLLVSLVLTAFYVRARYREHITTAAQVPSLVDMVLERLANQKELGEEELDDGWLFLPNLRDDVLRSIHSLRARERIWQKVKVVVELNSNVRTSQRESRSGEVGRAWEWIGPVKGDGARRRRDGGRPWSSAAAAAAAGREPVPAIPEMKKFAAPAMVETKRDIIEKKRPIF